MKLMDSETCSFLSRLETFKSWSNKMKRS